MAAKSLKCGECGKLLESVKAAQEHSDATSHTSFEETTEVIKVVVCTECGKPCRTDAERGLHTKFTGHTEYKDRGEDEVKPMDTEAQMAAAKADLMDTDDGGGGGGGGGGGAGGGTEAEEMVLADVNAEMMAELESMGFPHNRAVRALHFSGNSTVEGAINWLEANESDPDLDKELMVAKASSKPSGPKLSPEEAKKRADELVRKAKEKREREEKEAERHRELERIRSGKEMLAAKQKADEADRKRALDLRRLEKEEEARAREKIRLRLEEDRRERRRKLGLPEEPTEEEKAREAAEAEAARKADEERKAKAFVAVRPVSVLDKVRKVLVGMKKAHDDGGAANERFKAALSTLLKYIGNVVANPSEDKFRTIKMTNAAFQARVASVDGSVEVLKLAGFEEGPGGETLVMPAADAAAVETLRAIGPLINDALTNPFFGAL